MYTLIHLYLSEFCYTPESCTTLWTNYACLLSCFSRVQLFAVPWTVTSQVPLSMGFSWQEYLSWLPCPPLGDLPNSGIECIISYVSCTGRRVLYHWATWEAHKPTILQKKKKKSHSSGHRAGFSLFLAPVWWRCCAFCRGAGSLWGLPGTGAERKRGKETGVSPQRPSPSLLTPPFQSPGQKKEVSFGESFFFFFCFWLPFSSGIWSS